MSKGEASVWKGELYGVEFLEINVGLRRNRGKERGKAERYVIEFLELSCESGNKREKERRKVEG